MVADVVLVGAADVCQQHRAVSYLCWPHGSGRGRLAAVLTGIWWAGRLVSTLPREERQSRVRANLVGPVSAFPGSAELSFGPAQTSL